MAGRQLADWEVLQTKIFNRWVNQKLQSRNLPVIPDLVTGLGDGDNLANLMFALSEKQLESPKGSPKKKMPMVKAQRLEQINHALQFVWSCGVEMKLKPSPENLLSGDHRDVLGLIWALMTKYMKFDEDDEEQLSAKDALLRWLQFHTTGHAGVEITNLTKSFHSGMALCALLHKFKPDAIPFDTLDAGNAKSNLQLAMDVAEREFGVEKYLSPADIPKLDEKSSLVYISEYYYGINAQAKRVLAAKRITKLIKFTKENDAMKAKYAADGEQLLGHLASAEALLADVEAVDNTMAGAKKRLADFNTYKVSNKRAILSAHLEMEEAFKSLAARLSNHNRPAFVPTNPDMAPAALSKRINALQSKESVETALHTELHRQIKLAQMDKRHTTGSAKLTQWLAEKDTFVGTDVPVSSSGEARQQLKQFDSFVQECASMKSDSLSGLKDMGKVLSAEKYEHIAAVEEREGALEQSFKSLDEKAAAKKPVLQDNLSREQFKEKVRLWVKVHEDVHVLLTKWIGEKTAYLDGRETITSVQEAFLQLSLLKAYQQEKADQTDGNLARLKAQGIEIRDAKYKTDYSEWVYEKPEAISALESGVDEAWQVLTTKADAKQLYLDDALAREQFKEKTLLLVEIYTQLEQQIDSWGAEKAAYLAVKEQVTSSAEAKNQLSLLEAFEKDMAAKTEGSKKSFDQLAADILAAKYETEHSTWQYEKPSDITALQKKVETLWAQLSNACGEKKAILEDDLARELYAEETRLMAGQHSDKSEQISAWAAEKAAFLKSDPNVQSISDAQYHISVLGSYEKELAAVTKSAVASLKALGKDIAARKYSTSFSSYTYEATAEIQAREKSADDTWAELAALSKTRANDLQVALERELRKEELRLEFASQASELKRLSADKVSAIGTAEEQKTLFGYVLDEVENYGPKLAAEEKALQDTLAAKMAANAKVVEEMQSLQVTDNPYTSLTPADLEKFKASLEEAVAARRSVYDTHLKTAQDNDALCKKFAALVVPVAQSIAKGLVAAMDSSASEEAQLEVVTSAQATLEDSRKVLPEATTLDAEIKQRGIEINTHTNLTADDLTASLGHYEQVLTRKKPYLEKLIEYKQFRGISPEQYAEMEAIFKQYDKDASGSINEKELRTCLYSLGEERLKSEVQKYMREFGTGNELKFEPFRNLMIKLLGDSGSTDSMTESFKLISGGLEHVSKEALDKLLEANDVAFIASTAPAADADGYQFAPWIEEVFAR